YRMTSNPRGFCVVVNNKNFNEGTKLEDRDGTEEDVISLQNLFKQLYFTVDIHNNQTAEEIKSIVKWYKELDHSNYDCFVLVILSHGSCGNVLGVDGKEVFINDIFDSFDSIACSSLCGKPKLFFIQACQG
ncbi:hypothetical protein LOTGIDRAFT_58191, partial [Lottia gigantea]